MSVTLSRDFKSLPQLAAAKDSTVDFKTGSWRFERPVFVRQTAPCSEACPLGVNVPAALYLLEESGIETACSTILSENPFPEICGEICHHPCEKICNRKQYDEAVSVQALEKYIAAAGKKPAQEHKKELNNKVQASGKRIAVASGSMAGLSCSFFLSKMGHSVTVLEAGEKLSALSQFEAAEFSAQNSDKSSGIKSSALAALESAIAKLSDAGITIQTGVGSDACRAETLAGQFDAVWMPEDKSPSNRKVYMGKDILQLAKSGDTASFSGSAAVVGGGKNALDAALALQLAGCPVQVIYDVSQKDAPLSDEQIKSAKNAGISFTFDSQVMGVSKDGGLLCSDEGDTSCLKADIIVLAMDAKRSAIDMLPWIYPSKSVVLKKDAKEAELPKGDAAGRAAVLEMAAGKRAAIILDMSLKGISFLQVQQVMTGGMGAVSLENYMTGSHTGKTVYYKDLNSAYFTRTPRQEIPADGFTREQAVEAASRCFKCGTCNFCGNCFDFCPDVSVKMDFEKKTRQIDYDYCKGCGICFRECPRGAIAMEKE